MIDLTQFSNYVDTGEKILIRDGGRVYNEVQNPAIVYDLQAGRLKVGEKEHMEVYFNLATKKYIEAGFPDMAAG